MMPKTLSRTHEQRTLYDVHRLRANGENGAKRQPTIEEFGGLDRARLAALGYALDGPTTTGERFTGTVEIHRITYIGDRIVNSTPIDVFDERVAFRVLNELSLPRAGQLAVPVERLQEEANRLARLGF